MKLIIAIVQDNDVDSLMEKLVEQNYQVTKLASTGGFFREGNTTLLIGVSQEAVPAVLEIIKDKSGRREKQNFAAFHTEPNIAAIIPVEYTTNVGGAVIFVLEVDQFIKI